MKAVHPVVLLAVFSSFFVGAYGILGNTRITGSKHREDEADIGVLNHEALGKRSPRDAQARRLLHHKVHRRGSLVCGGRESSNSEVIYWKTIPNDLIHESSVGLHNTEQRYFAFQFDGAGTNNARLGIEIILVTAHATGRTLVLPPSDQFVDHLQGGVGLGDLWNLDALKEQKGIRMMQMDEFLARDDILLDIWGGSKPSPNLRGGNLWRFFENAGNWPSWSGRVLAFPANNASQLSADGGAEELRNDPAVRARLERFARGRQVEFYDKKLQDSKLLYIAGFDGHRLLQHHYAFNFFSTPKEQSFYKRFVRDRVRYRDEFHCAAAEVLALIREDARRLVGAAPQGNASTPDSGGAFVALHVRRGDFTVQYPSSVISAAEIVNNAGSVVPKGALVYVATDDPNGVCEGCWPCQGHPCLADPSWSAMTAAGWNVRFLKDYAARAPALGALKPHFHGIVEALICARAEVFVGTYLSTYSGFIHLVRGYHGLAEQSYYHTPGHLNDLRQEESVGEGWPREWRYGWTDDGGSGIRQ